MDGRVERLQGHSSKREKIKNSITAVYGKEERGKGELGGKEKGKWEEGKREMEGKEREESCGRQEKNRNSREGGRVTEQRKIFH